ncbi:MAG: hypothetical protein GXY67_07830 [Clostridiales bacterium]|nr:hypothetical protein [Clostridiales bacterium]
MLLILSQLPDRWYEIRRDGDGLCTVQLCRMQDSRGAPGGGYPVQLLVLSGVPWTEILEADIRERFEAWCDLAEK